MCAVQVLGPVRIAGVSVTSPTQRTLLSVLAAATPASVPFHRLVDAVWDDPPPSAENSLHSHLTRLRKALGPDSVQREGGAYRLHLPTDAQRFVEIVSDRGPAATHDRRSQLIDALAMWRGQPFGDDSDHPFVLAAADALLAQRATAHRELAQIELSIGQSGEAIAVLRRLLDANPLDEEGWALLVEALDASGRRADALRSVQDAISKLADVGLEPSEVLRAAEAAVLQEHIRPPATSRVPRTNGPLIGRGDELDRVVAAMTTPGWTTLIGPGGVGKTRLALEAAGASAIPLTFADLTEVPALEIAAAIARSVGAPLRPPYIDRLVGHIASHPLCLLLDSCELVGEELRNVGEQLLDACPELHVIATSRAALGVSGERLIEVTPLDVTAAAQLFNLRVETAGAPLPDPRATDALCRSVDCLPLNLEMLAGLLRSMSADDLLDAANDPMAVLNGPRGGLVSSVERSMSLLSDRERSTFEQLCLFRGPFLPETAIASAASHDGDTAVVEHLRGLRDRSLISSVDTPAGQRLRILDTVRAVGRTSLTKRRTRQVSELQFMTTLAARAARIGSGLRSPDEVRWLEIAEIETSDMRAAHQMALERANVDVALAIPAALFPLVYDRLRSDIAGWADESLDRFGLDHPLAARVLSTSALGAMHLDDHPRAWAQLDRARRCGGDDEYQALVAANLHLRAGALDATSVEGERVVEAALGAGDPYLATIGHVLRGLSASYRGDHDRADDIVREARHLSRQVGAPTLLAYADYLDGEVCSERNPTVALELLHRAHERAASSFSTLAEGVSLVTLTTIRGRSDQPAQAAADFGSAIRHWHRRGDWNLQWSTLRNFVEYLERTGSAEAAAALIGAIEAHGPQPFGVEARRFVQARALTEATLGPSEFERLRARGRSMTSTELVSYALDAADASPGNVGR